MSLIRAQAPGMATALAAAALAFSVHTALPAVPMLTAAVALGIVAAQLPALRPLLVGVLAPGLAFASRTLMRLGIVLLGLKLSLGDIAALGSTAILLVVAIVLATFGFTYLFGRIMRLPGQEPLLIAAGFSICGASAIGAMAGVTKAKQEEQATPITLVTLCGTLAIAVVVKLTRVLLLAPIIAVTAAVVRRRGITDSARPALVPLFVAGFLAAVVLRSFVPLPLSLLEGADVAQTWLLATALFGLGTSVRLPTLMRTGWRALIVALASWLVISALSLGAVWVSAA